jgi:hypothetical protein
MRVFSFFFSFLLSNPFAVSPRWTVGWTRFNKFIRVCFLKFWRVFCGLGRVRWSWLFEMCLTCFPFFFSFVTQAPHQQDPVQGPVLHAARPWQERESFLDTHSQFIVYSLRLLPFLFSHQLLFSLLLLLLVKITRNLSHTGGWMRIMLQRRFIAKRPIFGYIGRLGSL